METIVPDATWRRLRVAAFCLASGLFLYATWRLLQGSHVDTWKFAAMGSLYACFCLIRRGLFVLGSKPPVRVR